MPGHKKTPPEGGVPGKQSLTKSDSSLLPEAGCEGRSEKTEKFYISPKEPIRFAGRRTRNPRLPSEDPCRLYRHFTISICLSSTSFSVRRIRNPSGFPCKGTSRMPDPRRKAQQTENQPKRSDTDHRKGILPVWKPVEKLHTRCGKIPHTAHSMP